MEVIELLLILKIITDTNKIRNNGEIQTKINDKIESELEKLTDETGL